VKSKLDEIRAYAPTTGIPEASLIKMAKLGFVVADWMRETEVAISAVQCRTAVEEYFGVVPCAVMSMMSNNLPKHFFGKTRMDYQEILAGAVGKEKTYGTLVVTVRPSAMSFARISTDDVSGRMRGYVGGGAFTDDPIETFGGVGVVAIPDLQRLLRYICENGFEHHVAANLSNSAGAVHEAASRYLGWDMYRHGGGEEGRTN